MSDARLFHKILSNHASFVLTRVISFVLTPILFHSLQPENYAILIFALTTVSVLEGLDLGFYSTLVRFVSDLAAREKHLESKRLASSAFYLLGGLGTLATLALCLFSPFLARFFRVTGTAAAPGQLVLVLIGLSLAFHLPATALRGFLDGSQDFLRANVVDITTQLLRGALTLLLLWNGFGLFMIAAVFPAAALIRLLGMLVVARRASIPFRPRLAEADFRTLREASGFASLTFIMENAGWCFFVLDTFLTARLLPLSNLAILAVARRFPGALVELCFQTFVVAYPIISSAAARADRQIMRKFVVLSARNLFAFALPIAAALCVWTEEVLYLWIGPEVLAGVPIFRVFLVFGVFASLHKASLTFLQGVGKIRFSAALSVMMLVAGVGVGAWACAQYGLIGLAVSYAAVQMGGALLLCGQSLQLAQIPVRQWLYKAVAPSLWAALPTVLWFWISYRVLPHNLFGMMASVIPGVLLFGGLFTRLVTGPNKQPWQMRARRLLTEID